MIMKFLDVFTMMVISLFFLVTFVDDNQNKRIAALEKRVAAIESVLGIKPETVNK